MGPEIHDRMLGLFILKGLEDETRPKCQVVNACRNFVSKDAKDIEGLDAESLSFTKPHVHEQIRHQPYDFQLVL